MHIKHASQDLEVNKVSSEMLALKEEKKEEEEDAREA